MKQYLLAVHGVEGEEAYSSPEEMQQAFKDVDVFNAELKAKGNWVFAGGLHPADTATVVRVTDGEVLTTDGPFAETKEQLLGLYVVNCSTEEAAIETARDLKRVNPSAVYEIRPIKLYLPGAAIPRTEDGP